LGTNPFFDFLSARLESAEDGKASIVMPISCNLAQGVGLVAGGILSALADEAMAHAVISMLKPGQSTVTIEMNIRYLRAVKADAQGEIRALASVVKPGRSIMSTEAQVVVSENRLLATAGASFLVSGNM
jgi:uncharacterized protein (TIGR00369 family)